MPLEGEYAPSPLDWSREQADKYLESGGTEGTQLQGKPVVLLTTVGAKSGKLRKTPLMRVEHNGEYAIVASLGGPPKTRFGTTTSCRILESSFRSALSSATMTLVRCSITRGRFGGNGL